ncbi:PREDICTED: coiled-coil domain-containing protein 136 isoform X2 [Populus euphratica]|uniref:Coiled-coil domain-containing protein 136 isoform X2 n=1 Tax=Populus euphratica TaxID=75702 RepID=A0AAJ6VGD2_POPEU|nr:PREDICTED: coiled-coil domain-containing protein 136 isoform X2 [Populus euphratica]
MAATDPQRQLLTLIRDFASEKSQGERRVVGLKNRIVELGCQLDAANAEMEEVKRFKETTELELRGYEFQLAFNDVSIQTLEARISLIQDEISSVGSEVEGLKDEEGASRDEFIRQMFELNTKIRKFQAEKGLESQKKSSFGTTADCKAEKKVVTGVDLRALKDVLAHVASQIIKEEQEYLAEENILKQVQEEYVDLQRKVSLVDVIVKETELLQDLTRQTSELEQNCASLGEQLQDRCICPICRADNVEALGGVLQANEAN